MNPEKSNEIELSSRIKENAVSSISNFHFSYRNMKDWSVSEYIAGFILTVSGGFDFFIIGLLIYDNILHGSGEKYESVVQEVFKSYSR
jgi:hypothetical protein